MRETSDLNESGEITSVLVPTCPWVSVVTEGIGATVFSTNGRYCFVFSGDLIADCVNEFSVASSLGKEDVTGRGFLVAPF